MQWKNILPTAQFGSKTKNRRNTLIFNGNDVTGKFNTKFSCDQKPQQIMHFDADLCNIYHVCVGQRDNIFICPPGTVFNQQKQGCFDRYSIDTCAPKSYYKPTF